MLDTIIIGAGPAGLTSAIFASRRELKPLVISKEFGGQVITTPHIENYPGFKEVTGLDLMRRMEEQVKGFGVDIIYEEVKEIVEKKESFIVKIDKKEYEGKTVILAFGRSPRKLDVPGEKKFDGKGISYCVTCDAPLFRDRPVVVVGGGNAALDAALLMSKIGKKVYLIHRRQEFRGFESLVKKVKEKKNVELVLKSIVSEFKGDEFLESVLVENVDTKEKRELKADGAFIEIGSEVKTGFVKDLVKLDENGHIIVNDKCETFYPNSDKVHPGIFAAGDVTNTPFKQIVVAEGQGAIAGLQSYNYIMGVEGKVYGDWGELKK